MSSINRRLAGALLTLAVLVPLGIPANAAAQAAREQYTRALAQERVVRSAERPATVRQIRAAVSAYERLVQDYPGSGYSDNALWQAGNLALLAYQHFRLAPDRRTALRLLNQLKSSYPSSSLLERFDETIAELEAPRARPASAAAAPRATTALPRPATASPTRASLPPPVVAPAPTRSDAATGSTSEPAAGVVERVVIRHIARTALPDGLRVSIETDGEILFHHEQLDTPRRVFFDLRNARPIASLVDAALRFPDEVVQEIRVGRRAENVTRIVMDMNGVDSYSVFTLYNPYRVVVDFHRAGAVSPGTAMVRPPATAAAPLRPTGSSAAKPAGAPASTPPVNAAQPAVAEKIDALPLTSRQAISPTLAAPSVPAANSNGRFSIARQLGLGISRIVIDAGHGGHDPGARGSGIEEADLVLDVALRLRTLLEARPGMEVVMTRDTDIFIPLEERTAIANRESADLFLSIHANASTNTRARGVETYFLNFASNPEAAAVAARENSASAKTMHSLPEIVRAITLNNKIDESRDFAEMIQKTMVNKLAAKNAELKDLGVKQAPFVVLIGAGMPSVLAEISFVTHRQEGALLKTSTYRQQIAEALLDAVVGYQKSLKSRGAIAAREE